LHEQQSHTAGSGVDEHRVARLHAVGAAYQTLRRQAFQHHRGGGLKGNVVGQAHGALGREVSHFAVSAYG